MKLPFTGGKPAISLQKHGKFASLSATDCSFSLPILVLSATLLQLFCKLTTFFAMVCRKQKILPTLLSLIAILIYRLQIFLQVDGIFLAIGICNSHVIGPCSLKMKMLRPLIL